MIRTIVGIRRYVFINRQKSMSLRWRLRFVFVVWAAAGGSAWAQTDTSAGASATAKSSNLPDSVQPIRPTSLTFTASTDQRFYFFRDTRNNNGHRMPVSVYGLQAGFLFPSRRPRPALAGGRPASYKMGMGFYFVNQRIDAPGVLLPGASESVTRHLRILTAFYERYLLRRGPFEVSLPVEIGYGHSRYERTGGTEDELARGVFLPLGLGVSASYQFPNPRWFRPLHWFGFYVLTGYRFILKKDIPESQINYSGFYISVGPSFFLENLTSDLKNWRQKRKNRK